jgi:Do/DeqQ family serine protease
MNILRKTFPLFVAGVIGSAATLGAYKLFEKPDYSQGVTQNAPIVKTQWTGDQKNGNIPADFSFAAEKSTPAVVHIRSTMTATRNSSQQLNLPREFRDFFGDDFFFGPQQRSPQQSTGSGVIINADGYIVTNNHVIDEADEVEVTLYDKRSYKAEVVGTDPSTDLALLKIDQKDVPFLALGNSDDVKVGQWVLAVGNPFNLTSTVTAGIISAKGRNINILDRSNTPVESFIQTDAAVNPGNSGGALVNLNGDLIGINTAIASQTGSFAGYAFAVPVSIVRKVVDDLVKYGIVQRGLLGISIQEVDSKLAKEKNLKVNDGVYVGAFPESSAAREAGIKEGDVIVKIDNVKVGSVPQLQEQVAQHRPGDKVKVAVNRFGTEKIFDVVLKSNEGSTEISKNNRPEIAARFGADFEDLTAEEKAKLKVDGGVKVAYLYAGGKLRQTEMRQGFIITKVDDKPVKNLRELNAAIANKKGDVVLKGFYPGSDRMYLYAVEF